MPLSLAKHEMIYLRKNANFNEAWLHKQICKDTSMLTLGELRVVDHERVQSKAGRLDLLLADDDANRRYEVEIMLGATDPSHIIRTIEYWDIERRRYPAYDHVAVIVAEDITTRFLNVMALLAGSIPLIAIQLNALRIENNLVLDFIQVLDQTSLREDDTDDPGGTEVDRAYWENRVDASILEICDAVLAIINDAVATPQQLNFKQRYIGLQSNGVVRNFVAIAPKKKFVRILFQNSNADEWLKKMDDAGLEAMSKRKGRFSIKVDPASFAEHRGIIQEALRDTASDYAS